MTRELEAALEAAWVAGEELRDAFGGEREIRYKGEVDLVTDADERAERTIRESLRGAFPDYGILAEESGQTAGGGEARWIVDPLDGTTNFAHGLPIFSVSVALERSGELVLGVVYAPMTGETFVAERGAGATLNGEPLSTSDAAELGEALLVTGLPYDRADMPLAIELFGNLALVSRGIRRLGSAALDLCYVAAGRLDAYFERGIHAWDIAAGIVILEEAGGRVSDYSGHEPDLEGGEIVASNGPLHEPLVEVLSGG